MEASWCAAGGEIREIFETVCGTMGIRKAREAAGTYAAVIAIRERKKTAPPASLFASWKVLISILAALVRYICT